MAKNRPSPRKRSNPPKPKKSNKADNKMMIVVAVIVIAVVGIAAGIFLLYQSPDNDDTMGENPVALINTTKGLIEIELFANQTPYTVENFVKLANDGFYDGLIFHRISDDFMIQAGNTFPDGSVKESPYGSIQEFEGSVSHVDGAISMASTGAGVPGSAQFFICDGAQTFLDGNYAAFGVVISGIDVVRDIADDPHDSSLEPSPGGGRPLDDIIINSISIKE